MRKASDLLQFNFSPMSFRQSADKIIPTTLVNNIRNRISQHNIFVQKLGNSSFAFDDDSLKIRSFRKFKSSFSGNSTTFSKRELRALIYGLDYSEGNNHAIIDSEYEFGIFLNTLNSNWRDTYIEGLILFLLKNWELNSKTSLNKLADFINIKLKEYNGGRKTLIAFKSNRKYFDLKNGDLILGNDLALKNKTVKEATAFLTLADSWVTFPYFSRVILAHYEIKKTEIVTLIDDYDYILELHNNSTTNKRVVSKLIIQANMPEYATLQEKIKNLAFKLIGDPENKIVWDDFCNATEKEKSDIKTSRKILNEWITRQFINVFFKVCLNDERRKRFWLKYADRVISFKVYGTFAVKNILSRDERIAKYLEARFETLSSKKSVSAFVLYIGNYMLIEFSDSGYAFYAYKVNGACRPNLSVSLNSVDALRDINMGNLVYRTGKTITKTNEEGRMAHNDGDLRWENVFDYWLQKYVPHQDYNDTAIDYGKYIDSKAFNPMDFDKHLQTNKKIDLKNTSNAINTTTDRQKLTFDNQKSKGGYNVSDDGLTWETKLLFWSAYEKQGYKYSHNKDAWWKKK